MSACIYARSWSTFCDITLRDRFMPVAVTVMNAFSTHKISAACLRSDAGMCCGGKNMKNTRDTDFVTFEIWVLVLAALSLAQMFIEWISVWRIPMLNDQRYWSKAFEWNACMRLELTDTNLKRTFLVYVSIYTKIPRIWTLISKDKNL